MKLFGAQRRPGEETLLQTQWFRRLLTFCAVLIILAVCIEVGRRAMNLGKRVVEAHPVPASIVIANPAPWLDRAIIQHYLLQEAYDFARRDDATYNRCRNVLDSDVLREIADLYVGPADGKNPPRQSVGFNAWIKRITAVKRNVAANQSAQIIEIYAEWRNPVAWIKANKGAGDMLYLIDADGVRLPGDYPLTDRAKSRFMVVAGIDLPIINGQPGIPAPGEAWTAGKSGALGEDLKQGLKLVATLQTQLFAHQIDAIDMTNLNGRHDPKASWIVLNTIFTAPAGGPHIVQWGRPIGAEGFREVRASAKLDALNTLYRMYKRIDAGREYVDVRWDTVTGPHLATEAEGEHTQMAAE